MMGPEFFDRLAEDFPTIRHRCEQDRRVRSITVLSEDWADKPVLRERELFSDSSLNRSLHALFDRVDQDHQDWLVEKSGDPDSGVVGGS